MTYSNSYYRHKTRENWGTRIAALAEAQRERYQGFRESVRASDRENDTVPDFIRDCEKAKAVYLRQTPVKPYVNTLENP